MRYRFVSLLILCALGAILAGCGTTKWTDTRRSATEQLLITDAMDRAVDEIDFRALADKQVYLDAKPLEEITDADYLISSLRQHMLACGCILKDKETEADYIVEARAGAVGTDRHELTYGIPSVNIPAVIPVAGVGIPPQIPEMPFVTRTDQRAVTKIAAFAYNRETGRPIWQSGIIPIESTAKATWLLGAGPFQRGSIYQGTEFAGQRLKSWLFGARPFRRRGTYRGTDLAGNKLDIPLVELDAGQGGQIRRVSVDQEAYFFEPIDKLAQRPATPGPDDAAKSTEAAKGSSPAGPSSKPAPTSPTTSPPQPAAERPLSQPPWAPTPATDTPPGTPLPPEVPSTAPPTIRMPPLDAAPSVPEASLPPAGDLFREPPGSPYPWYGESFLDQRSAPPTVSPWLDPPATRAVYPR